MNDKFDKQGKPLTLKEWAKLLENSEYKRVAETTLPNGKWVSTVWMGLDHNFGGGKPLIFETMVFKNGDEEDVERYSTLKEAQKGHKIMVKKHSN